MSLLSPLVELQKQLTSFIASSFPEQPLVVDFNYKYYSKYRFFDTFNQFLLMPKLQPPEARRVDELSDLDLMINQMSERSLRCAALLK
jgi:hypothetical protein